MHNGTCASIDEMERFCKRTFVEPYDYISNTQWMDGRGSEWMCIYVRSVQNMWLFELCHAMPFHFMFGLCLHFKAFLHANQTHTLTHSVAHNFFFVHEFFLKLSSESKQNEMTRLGGCLQRCTEMDLDLGAIINWNLWCYLHQWFRINRNYGFIAQQPLHLDVIRYSYSISDRSIRFLCVGQFSEFLSHLISIW